MIQEKLIKGETKWGRCNVRKNRNEKSCCCCVGCSSFPSSFLNISDIVKIFELVGVYWDILSFRWLSDEVFRFAVSAGCLPSHPHLFFFILHVDVVLAELLFNTFIMFFIAVLLVLVITRLVVFDTTSWGVVSVHGKWSYLSIFHQSVVLFNNLFSVF